MSISSSISSTVIHPESNRCSPSYGVQRIFLAISAAASVSLYSFPLSRVRMRRVRVSSSQSSVRICTWATSDSAAANAGMRSSSKSETMTDAKPWALCISFRWKLRCALYDMLCYVKCLTTCK